MIGVFKKKVSELLRGGNFLKRPTKVRTENPALGGQNHVELVREAIYTTVWVFLDETTFRNRQPENAEIWPLTLEIRTDGVFALISTEQTYFLHISDANLFNNPLQTRVFTERLEQRVRRKSAACLFGKT